MDWNATRQVQGNTDNCPAALKNSHEHDRRASLIVYMIATIIIISTGVILLLPSCE